VGKSKEGFYYDQQLFLVSGVSL